MKITQVHIKGFQSHVDSVFNLSDGLTVITGPSDAGKTAIVRALRWLAFNEPQGEAFLHTIRNADGSIKEAVDQASVEVTFEDGTIVSKTRKSGKTTYTHSGYPSPWCKAEIPPEVKETLGLMKQEYGDFSTCLNFAFQLDAPFLLSETASVGAKVLGKIAGTEIVDKANGEVNKRTHKARVDASNAEKRIGQLDVELLDYLTLDEKQAAYDAAKDRAVAVQASINTVSDLRGILSTYWKANEALVASWDKLQPLHAVVMLKPRLQTVEYNQKKLEAIRDYEADFWKSVNEGKEAREKLRKLESLKDNKAWLDYIMELQATVEALTPLASEHSKAVVNKWFLEEEIKKQEAVLYYSDSLEYSISASEELESLQALQNERTVAVSTLKLLKARVDSLEPVSGIRGKLEALAGTSEKLKQLEDLQRQTVVIYTDQGAKKMEHTLAVKRAEEAQTELHEAWEAAGGICPLCGGTLEGGVVNA